MALTVRVSLFVCTEVYPPVLGKGGALLFAPASKDEAIYTCL